MFAANGLNTKYKKTLDSYKSFFGSAAPKNIWPKPSVRFRYGLNFVRANTKLDWLVSKRRTFWKTAFVVTILIILAVFIFRIKMDLVKTDADTMLIQTWLVENSFAILVVTGGLLAVLVNIKWSFRRSGKRSWVGGCGTDAGSSAGGDGDGGGCGGGCGD